MCGIYGIAGKIEDSDQFLVRKMGRLIKYRGPNDDGYYFSNKAVLGMRRLSIIDLKSGRQPIKNEEGNIFVFLNGEIYNYQELRDNLIKNGHRLSTKSDTEVIVHLYEDFGLDFVRYLRGMFVIAIWDEQGEKLILARDRLGIKPLYFWHNQSRLVFGSEIKIILADHHYSKGLDYESLYHYFSFKNIPAPKTIYKDINNLLPGHLLVYEKNKIKINRYWQLIFKENYNYSEKELITKLLQKFEEVVKIHTITSDVPVGAYLSGGVDSSLVVGIMSKLKPRGLETFSLGYKPKIDDKDELDYAKEIAKKFKTNHYQYIMPAQELIQKINNVISHFDEPFSGSVSHYFISRLIGRHVKVALSGDGADELFGSYAHHRLVRPITNYLRIKDKKANSKIDWRPYEDNISYVKEIAEKKMWDWRSKLFVFTDDEKDNLFSNLIKKKFKGFNSQNLLKKYFINSTAKDPLNIMLDVDINTLIPDQALPFVDRLSMAHSVEVRVPYLDHLFVEFTATIPESFKNKEGISKYILKRAAEELLPKEVIYRPKIGFVSPNHIWLRRELKPNVLQILSPRNVKKHSFLNYNYIKKILDQYYLRKVDHTHKIWTILIFQLWWDQYFG